MEEKQKENLKKMIENYNTNGKDVLDAEIDNKIKIYFSTTCESLKKSNNKKAIKEFLTEILSLDFTFYSKYGDDLLEKFWILYDKDSILIEGCMSIVDYIKIIKEKKGKESINRQELQYYLLSQFLQHNEKNLERLIKNKIIKLKEINEINKKSIDNNITNNNNNNDSNTPLNVQENNNISFTSSNQDLKDYVSINNLKQNDILDIIVLIIFTKIDFQNFYISLATFLVSTNSSTVLLFKIISLISLCFVNLNNISNFTDSILFCLGSVLRDHARSYLKTKNKYDESLTYHVCKKKHGKKEHQFSDPIILSAMECDYLEMHFISVLVGFIMSVVVDFKCDYGLDNNENKGLDDTENKGNKENDGIIKTNTCVACSKNDDENKNKNDYTNYSCTCFNNITYKWENYKEIFYKYLDLEDIDVEEQIHSGMTSLHYTMLFLSDLVFFFTANFSSYSVEEKSKYYFLFFNFLILVFFIEFSSKFKNFNLLLEFSLAIFGLSTNNYLNLFNFSYLKSRFLEVDCDRTNYMLKDKFNHYGLCLINYFYFIERIQLRNLVDFYNNEKEIQNDDDIVLNSLIPYTVDHLAIIKTIISSFTSICKFERLRDHNISSNYVENYLFLVKDGLVYLNEEIKDIMSNDDDSKEINEDIEKLLFEVLVCPNTSNSDVIGIIINELINYLTKDTLIHIFKKASSSKEFTTLVTNVNNNLQLKEVIKGITNDELYDIFYYLVESTYGENEDNILSVISLIGKNRCKEAISKIISCDIDDFTVKRKEKEAVINVVNNPEISSSNVLSEISIYEKKIKTIIEKFSKILI